MAFVASKGNPRYEYRRPNPPIYEDNENYVFFYVDELLRCQNLMIIWVTRVGVKDALKRVGGAARAVFDPAIAAALFRLAKMLNQVSKGAQGKIFYLKT